MIVFDYLEAASRLPWLWGGGLTGFEGHDCTLFAAGLPIMLGDPDPAEGLRGTYQDEAGAQAVIERHTGMRSFIAMRLLNIGWRRATGELRDCDIGVVEAPLAPLGHVGLIPAIRAGGLWVVRTKHGQRARSYDHVAAWRR